MIGGLDPQSSGSGQGATGRRARPHWLPIDLLLVHTYILEATSGSSGLVLHHVLPDARLHGMVGVMGSSAP